MLSSKQIEQILSNPPSTPRAALLWKLILEISDPFAQPLGSKLFAQSTVVDTTGDKSSNPYWKLSAGSEWPSKFLPIRSFRTSLARSSFGEENPLVFLSSGTASGSEGRSKSGFSSDGEKLYRAASLKAFSHVIEKATGTLLSFVRGISLVPRMDEWPDSSLARMVHWISEITEVKYGDYLNPKALDALCKESGNKPLFIFATAFHLIDLLDSGYVFRLPNHSVVIETGGTKGKTRSVSRIELYELIAQGFQIDSSQIISEYGMCELASQAYDFVPWGEHRSLRERTFQFPSWAPVKVMNTPEEAVTAGVGALTVWDQARIDVEGPIQTEDLCEVFSDGRFKLLGRVQASPLKGCSLNVDDVASTRENQVLGVEDFKEDPTYLTREHILANLLLNAQKARDWIEATANDEIFLNCLAHELGSKHLGEDAVADLKAGLPRDVMGYFTAAKGALGSLKTLHHDWLVIPPSTHSLASLHTITMMAALGVHISVRLPGIMGQAQDGSAFGRALEIAKDFGLNIVLKPSSLRLSSSNPIKESILVFGDDDTIAHLRNCTRAKVVGFGNMLAATVVDAMELEENSRLYDLIAKDNSALAQRGCMSARMNFIQGILSHNAVAKITDAVNSKLRDLAPPDIFTKTARAIESVRLSQLGAQVFSDPDDRWTIAIATDPIEPWKLLSRLEFVIVFIQQSQNYFRGSNFSKSLPGLRRLAVSDHLWEALGETHTSSGNSYSIERVRLGNLNAPMLSGEYLRRPIFGDLA